MASDLRNRILDAAVRLLEREGPRAFRQTRVAEEAGVEQGHLTYYFPKKADLAEAVVERIVGELRGDASEILERASGTEDPRTLVFDVVKSLVRDRKRTRLLLTFLVEHGVAGVASKPLAEAWAQQRLVFAAMLGRPEEDPRIELAIATIRGLALDQVIAPRSPERIDELVDQLVSWLGVI